MESGSVVSALSSDCDHTPLCVRHAVSFRLRCGIRLYPFPPLLQWPTLSCSIRLDPLRLYFVAVVDTKVSALSAIWHNREGVFRCSRSGIYGTLCCCINGTMLRGLARLCPRSRLAYRLPRCYDA